MDTEQATAAATQDLAGSGTYLLLFSRESASLVSLEPGVGLHLTLDDDGSLHGDSTPQEPSKATIVALGDEITLQVGAGVTEVSVNGEPLMGSRSLASGDVIALGSATAVVNRRPGPWATSAVLGRRQLLQRLQQETERSLRYRSDLSVLVVRLAGPQSVSEERINEAVVDSVRRVDIVGRAHPREVIVLLPETGEAATIPAARVLSALASSCPHAAAGLASCPADGVDADTLVAGARSAAQSAAAGQVQRMSDEDHQLLVGDLAVIAVDPKTRELLALARQLAASDIPVLITGETGVGKEVFAQAIHAWSRRSALPMVSLNCAVMPDSMTEAVLFGHEKGAFTGAEAARPGLLEGASGGTLFLDEVSEAPARTQAELLRVLETKKVRRVGALAERTADVRLIAATNRDPTEILDNGQFRQDLYYRLNGAMLVIPPLRDRMLDLPALARAFMTQACARQGRAPLVISTEAMQRLGRHDWPGNVRELRNLIDYLVAVVDGDEVLAAHLPKRIAGQTAPWLHRPSDSQDVQPPGQSSPAAGPPKPEPFQKLSEEIQELERTRMTQALEAAGGVRVRAAELIGMPLRTFVTKLKVHGLVAKQSGGECHPRRALRTDASAVPERV